MLATLLTISPGGAQADAVGHASLIVRSVFGTVELTRRPVATNDPVFWLELIETGADSAAKLMFVDDTTLSTGPDSRVRIDEFVYSGEGDGRRIVIGISRGVLRFVTGSSPSPAYAIRTPSAMIGVRGTDFIVSVGDDGATSVAVRHGRVLVTPTALVTPIEVASGLSIGIGANGAPNTAEPVPPDGAQQAEATTISALLAVAGDGTPAAAFEDSDVSAVGGLRGAAASARAATGASQLGAGCSGC